MVEYNQYGLPKENDYSTTFRFDETLPTDIIIKPPSDYKHPKIVKDEDKEYFELNPEEKEVHDCMEDEDEENYEELEDDFVMKANCGEPIYVPKEEEELEDYDEEEGSEEEITIDNPLTKEQFNDVLNDFIRQHNEKEVKLEDEPKKKAEDESEEEEPEDTPEEKKELIDKMVQLQNEFVDNMDRQPEEEVAEPRKKTDWDIETIASSHNNTDNRPAVLVDEPLKEPKKKVPTPAPAETPEIPVISPKTLKGMTREEKAQYKKDIKAMQREKRKQKKNLKIAFRSEQLKLSQKAAGTGDVGLGVSVKPF